MGQYIDAVFQQGLDTLQTQVYVTYFSYHESLIPSLPKLPGSQLAILPESVSS